MKMVLNELSCQFPRPTLAEGQKLIKNFLHVYHTGVKLKLHKSVIIVENLDGTLLSANYPLAKWRNDSAVDIEIRRLYRRLYDLAEIIDDNLYDRIALKDFIAAPGRGLGLAIAYELQGISISFLSNDFWGAPTITGQVKEINATTGELKTINVDIPHASKTEHFHTNQTWIKSKLSEEKFEIVDGKDLWYKKEALFPNLAFCESTRKQLGQLRKKSAELRQIIKHLIVLDEYFAGWNGTFEKDQLSNVDPESDSTLIQYKEEHSFTAPDGRRLLFTWHARFTGGDYEGRIFFEPDPELGKGIIGHIGKKLPTVSWSNP